VRVVYDDVVGDVGVQRHLVVLGRRVDAHAAAGVVRHEVVGDRQHARVLHVVMGYSFTYFYAFLTFSCNAFCHLLNKRILYCMHAPTTRYHHDRYFWPDAQRATSMPQGPAYETLSPI